MNVASSFDRPRVSIAFALLVLSAAACASSKLDMSTTAPTPDKRVGLRAGWMNAAEAAWNLRVVSRTEPSPDFINRSTPGAFQLINSDLSFSGNYVIQGNFSGYQVWDISNPNRPTLHTSYVCPGSQSDVSVYRKLMFVSGESLNGRTDCGTQGVHDTVSHERLRGIRIFDITDIARPKYLTNVQTCRGSHTHTVVTDPNDSANVYIYVSGSAPVRSPNELPGCSNASLDVDSNSALFRIEVIRVPLAAPEQAAIVSSPRIFDSLTAPARHGEAPEDIAAPPPTGMRNGVRPGPTQCHDITVYPAIGLAGGACGGYGLLLDIRDVANPKRIGAVADSNFSFWHSATFNNDGTKILFTDEWGGGLQPRCRVTDKHEWGADAIFTLVHDTMTFQSYYKMPAPQTPFENCVAHNGSLIPIPGRDIMAQGWYQGGISVFDWTDPAHPTEIAYFDRGPMDSTKLLGAGSWAAYWYNGYIVSSELARGLDMFELVPSGFMSENELDAAKLGHLDYFNPQDQARMVWPASFVVARAYLDQMARSNGLAPDNVSAARRELAHAERLSGQQRKDALTQLASQLNTEAPGAADPAKVRTLAAAVTDLANAEH